MNVTGIENFFQAILQYDIVTVADLLREDRSLANTVRNNKTPLLSAAGVSRLQKIESSLPLCQLLLEAGADVKFANAASSPLEAAINAGDLPVVKFLLEAGADPNVGRTFFAAFRDEKKCGMQCVELLFQYNADVNRLFAMFGDRNAAKSALDFAPERFKKRLIEGGAKTTNQILSENPNIEVEGAKN